MIARFYRIAAIVALLLPTVAGAETRPETKAEDGVTVTVAVAGLRNTNGNILACLTTKAVTFPECEKDPQSRRMIVPARNGPALVFRHVTPGTYAVSLFHDEDANGRLDKRMGIPTEGYGFSRDAAIMFGPPKFDAAKVTVGTTDLVLPIKIRYIL